MAATQPTIASASTAPLLFKVAPLPPVADLVAGLWQARVPAARGVTARGSGCTPRRDHRHRQDNCCQFRGCASGGCADQALVTVNCESCTSSRPREPRLLAAASTVTCWLRVPAGRLMPPAASARSVPQSPLAAIDSAQVGDLLIRPPGGATAFARPLLPGRPAAWPSPAAVVPCVFVNVLTRRTSLHRAENPRCREAKRL